MIVLDANAAIAIVLGTETGNALELIQDDEEIIAAPQLFCAEVSHVLGKYVRGGYIDRDEAVSCCNDALELVDMFENDASLATEALTESLRLEHSSYDLFYFVLARRFGATLFTLDKKLQALCEEGNVNCIWIGEI